MEESKKINKNLTLREFQILNNMVLGKSNREMSKELFINANTLKDLILSIFKKLSVEDRVQASVKAIRDGLI